MSKGRLKKISAAVLFCAAVAIFSSAARAQRLMPPESVKCDPNNLTSFTGRVISYRRSQGHVTLRMRTDEGTTENFTLLHKKPEDAARSFLMKGESFKQSDWALIERRRNQLRPHMRATVWLCADGSELIVDWRPGERGQTTF